MKELMQDPMFFYDVAFVLFLALAFVFGRKPVGQWLDDEIAKVSGELDNARKLRAEAEAALASCRQKQAQAEADAKLIVKSAQEQVDAIRKQAEQDLTAQIVRQKHLAAERIRMIEHDAITEIRSRMIALGMEIARKNLSNLSEKDSSRLVEQAIAEVPALKVARK